MDQFLAELSCTELDRWHAYFQERHFTRDVNKFMLAQICVVLAARGGKRMAVDDFYPATRRRLSLQTEQQQLAWWRNNQ